MRPNTHTVRTILIAKVFCAAILLVQFGVVATASAVRPNSNSSPGSESADSSRIESPASANRLKALVNEALLNSPVILAARSHWQALTRVPRQVSTLPDPMVGLTHFTVGSPQPFSGYETSDFYYTGFGFSQDIPGPGKLGLKAKQAQKDAEAARDAYRLQQRQVAEQVREGYFNLFYLQKLSELLRQTREQLAGVAETAEAQYHVAMAQQQDVLKAQLEVTKILRDQEMSRADFQEGQANLKAVLGRDQDSATSGSTM